MYLSSMGGGTYGRMQSALQYICMDNCCGYVRLISWSLWALQHECRGIDAGNNDVLMVDSSAGLVIQTRNIRTGNSEESIDDTWMLSAVLAALLLSLIFCVCASAGRYPEMTNSRRWILLEYIHRSDGKKRAFIGI